MIVIDTRRCTGCGACLEACPHGAIYLIDDVAVVDGALCRECEHCVAACSSEAISQITTSEAPVGGWGRAVTPVSQPNIIRVRTEPVPAPIVPRVLPAMGSVLAWAGQQILPRLADYVLYRLDRRLANKRAPAVTRKGTESATPGAGRGSGRQRRQRRRHGP